MKLTRDQKKLLRFVFNRFPTAFNGSGEGVRLRSSVNPPTQKEVQTALRLVFVAKREFGPFPGVFEQIVQRRLYTSRLSW